MMNDVIEAYWFLSLWVSVAANKRVRNLGLLLWPERLFLFGKP